MSRLVVLQPSFLPWLGHLDQYQWADVFVSYDDTQYDKNGWRNRNRILTPNGVSWLTVPVITKGLDKPKNNEVRINNSVRWQKKMIATLAQSYSKTPYFSKYLPELEAILMSPRELLVDLNLDLFRWLVASFELPWTLQRSSSFDLPGRKTDRLVAICRKFGATEYLTGDAARDYLEVEKFREVGVEVRWHNYDHPVYDQGVEPFVPYLSVVDLLFRHGSSGLEILRRSR